VADIVIYGATPSGLAAAFAIADYSTRLSLSVAVLEPSWRIGGMMTNGIGLRDFAFEELLQGSMREWAEMNANYYNQTEGLVWQPDNHVGERHLWEMLRKRPSISVYLGRRIALSKRAHNIEDGVIKEIVVEHENAEQRVSGKIFVDSSYEGDLMSVAGVSFTSGRESQWKYNEELGGVTNTSRGNFGPFQVKATWDSGALLKYVNSRKKPVLGASDDNMMGWSFRFCLTSREGNQVPFPKPERYDPNDFELLRRYYKNGGLGLPYSALDYRAYPQRDKFDACDSGETVPISTDAVGLAVGYFERNYSARENILKDFEYYVKGLLHFLMVDGSVPDIVRAKHNELKLCKDEWADNGNWPQIYIREGRRLVGDRVFHQRESEKRSVYSEKHILTKSIPCYNDTIALGQWWYDIHIMQRFANLDEDGSYFAQNEGQTSYAKPGQGRPLFEIPLYVVLPAKSESRNLVVTTCVSVSHVVFAAIRVEPTRKLKKRVD